ncbi:hypothetical protein MUK42_16361 [Musa troglodytarum]|uniref:Uncharacterized protein n=1 Tax=Musa troglodytarum TaxID=320322 RepID=A0A9E7GZI8_9LILI|nr:hypothetical protein MUK42_16361 [Musa troglodytarum]
MREAARRNRKRGIRNDRKPRILGENGDEATDYLLLLLLAFHSVPESEVPRIAPSEFSTTQGIGTPGEGS